jgi:iron complex outermembrane receptor protein
MGSGRGQPGNTTGIYTFGNNGYTNANTNVRSIHGPLLPRHYTLAPDTHLIAGLRYTSDARHLTAQTTSYNGNTGATTQSALTDAQHNVPAGHLARPLDHRFSRDAMVYASYNRGFRSAPISPRRRPAAPCPAQPRTGRRL